MDKGRLEEFEAIRNYYVDDMRFRYGRNPYSDIKLLISTVEEQRVEVEKLKNKVSCLEKENNELTGVGGMWMSARNKLEQSQEQNKRYREAIDRIKECVNEHLSDGTEVNPYKIDDIIDDLEGRG